MAYSTAHWSTLFQLCETSHICKANMTKAAKAAFGKSGFARITPFFANTTVIASFSVPCTSSKGP